jgi:hypothetical protein
VSFLDNLENNLKALESREERDPERARLEREAEEARKEAARSAAPIADQLKRGPFTNDLLTVLRTLGHERKLYVRITWVDTVLRLEAEGRRVDLVPTASGVIAQDEGGSRPVDLNGDGTAFGRQWLDSVRP